jgi:hypothetical protein
MEEPVIARRYAGVLGAAIAAACCGGSGDPASPDYSPDIPATWAVAVTNPWFPLVPGTRRDYRAQTPDGVETSRLEVVSDTRTIQGVQATIVHDQVFLDGALVEDTFDWFAQDGAGNVWYLGEDSKEIENGQVVSTQGSWEWGVNGGLPGVMMWGDPASYTGEYRQEFSRGVAEDLAAVVSLDASVQVSAGSYTGCVETRERNALEAGSVELKYYCRDVGNVLETDESGGQRNELTQVTGP